MHGGAHGFKVWRTAALPITAITDIPWQAAQQSDEFWSASRPNDLVIPDTFPAVSFAHFEVQVAWQTMPTSKARLIGVYRNDHNLDDIIRHHDPSCLGTEHIHGHGAPWVEVHPGDFFTVEVNHGHGAGTPVNVNPSEQSTWFSMHWIGTP